VSAARSNLERYDRFGWDYEAFGPLGEKEAAWYLRFARETGGPVLELACGSGRLVAFLAAEGSDVAGVDLSETMLSRARMRVGALPAEAARRVTLHACDIAALRLDRKFGLAVIADNSFRYALPERERQLSCLRCVRRHLEPDGTLLVTERRFEPELFTDGVRLVPWSSPMRHPDTGDLVCRRMEFRSTQGGAWMQGRIWYRTTHADGSETVEEFPFDAPVLSVDDYTALLAEAGFDARLYVGYELREDDGKDPVLCFVCNSRRVEGD